MSWRGARDQLLVPIDDLLRGGLALGRREGAAGQPMSLMPIIRVHGVGMGLAQHVAVENAPAR